MKLIFANNFTLDVATVNEGLVFVDGIANRKSVVAEVMGATDNLLDLMGTSIDAEAATLITLSSGDKVLREYKNCTVENVSQFMNNFNIVTNLTFSLDFVPEN